MSRIGTGFLNLGTWADGEDPGAGPQTEDNSRINGNWIKIDKYAKENKIWVGTTPPSEEHTIEHTLWLDISNINLPIMKKWKEDPGEWIKLWTWKHGELEDLEDDQHPQYLLKNGIRKLDANYIPSENKSIVTKEYVDGIAGGWAPFWGAAIQNLAELRAIINEERTDKQIRYVEDKKALYGYDAEHSSILNETQIENCDDEWNQYVYHTYEPGDEQWIISEIDTTDKKEGSASVKLTAQSQNGEGNPVQGGLYASEDIAPIDLRNYSFIKLWVKPSNGFLNKHLYIVLTNGVIDDNDPPPEEVRLPLPILTSTEWQEVTLYFSDAIITGGNIDDILSNVTSIGLRLNQSEWADHGNSIMLDDIRAFKTTDDNENYIVPDDLIGSWVKIADLTNPLQKNLDANEKQIKNLGAPTDNEDAVRQIDLETGLNTKADKKDYPLRWHIDGWITDGTQIDSVPSVNGYNAGEQYAVNHTGNIHNGNVYRVKEDDTWELLEVRHKGIGVLLKSNLIEYYYAGATADSWWNDALVNKQDKDTDAGDAELAMFINGQTKTTNKTIHNSASGVLPDDDNKIPTAKVVKDYVDNNSGGGTDLGMVTVSNPSELQAAIDTLATINGGNGGTIYLKSGQYNLTQAIILKRTTKRIILLTHGSVEIVRPDNDNAFRLEDVNSGDFVYSIIGLGFDASGKSGNYAFIFSDLIYPSDWNQLTKPYIHRCRFSNNSWHAIRGRIAKGIVTENSFFNIDGYAFYGGYMGNTIYATNLYNNDYGQVGLNNEHGFMYSGDGNFVVFKNNNFYEMDNRATMGDLVYNEYDSSLKCEISNNYFHMQGFTLPSGKYMVHVEGGIRVKVADNFGSGCGSGSETNLTHNPPNIIVTNNYATDQA